MPSASYATVSVCGDFGPWIAKLILDLPLSVVSSSLSTDAFNVYCERYEVSGSLLLRAEENDAAPVPSVGYLSVADTYLCDEKGNKVHTKASSHIALILPEVRLTKQIEGTVTGSRYIENRFRVTQLTPLESADASSWLISGLVFDRLREAYNPNLVGWHDRVMSQKVNGIVLPYGYYDPGIDKKAPLIVWLHGAGEGGGSAPDEGPIRAYTGNRVTALSQTALQQFFGGAAWVLVPQCPTFWMDDGIEQLGRSNQSIYSKPLKTLIDTFISQHANCIDTDHIVIGGLSNGGFMTVRMCLDYPEFFSAGIAACAPFFVENQTPEVITTLAKTPLWFVHSKGDELVDPAQTVLPLYHKLRMANANVHCTYFDHVEDLTGRYKESDGRPKRIFSHGVWIHVYNDFCHTDLDGTNVILQGEPVGIWEWAARQYRSH